MFMSKPKACVIFAVAAMLPACVSMPAFPESEVPPEFAEQIKNADRFPDVADAPAAPTDIPRARVWDAKARKMMRAKGSFDGVDAPDGDISAQVLRQIQTLSQLVNEHILDDPK